MLVDPDQHSKIDSSEAEVQRVVELILDHAVERPDESLGVIALGIKHADRINETLRRRLADLDDSSLESYFDDDLDERFFVKNLAPSKATSETPSS
ncbi:MAG: hypothetical protein U5R31_07530 [Acidimicrobiia bacterium]|nr:hypothetical protein [Acidimicrobiia bacterium]